MRLSTSISALILAHAAAVVRAQLDPAVSQPLIEKRFTYPNEIPYKVDTDQGTRRGPQHGYNICNSTTDTQSSLCQTAFVNSVDDFCLWGPPEPNSAVGDTEGEAIAWCSKPGRGTRVIPEGALTGVQFMRTSAYVQVVGFIDQAKINIASDDSGGEMDPHGADLRGNPLGGLVYSNAFASNNGNNNSFQQVIEWHNFMGDNFFCMKACDPAGSDDANFCQHIYDRIGCRYNAPNNAQNGTFESCEGATQDFPGIYTDASGARQTYTQPPESLGAIQTLPYDPRVPASSNCVTYSSAQLYAGAASRAPAATSTSAAPTATTSIASSRSGRSVSSTRSQTGATPTNTSGGSKTLGFSIACLLTAVSAFTLSYFI